MGINPGPPKQQSYAPYTPQPQYYVQSPPPKQSHSPQPQNQQQYSPYQPPQQPQYYFPPQQQQQHAASTPPGPAAPAQQQQFLAELEAPQFALTPKPRPTSSSSATRATSQDGAAVFEMSADPAAVKPTTPRPVSSSGSVNSTGQKPLIQANPWGFFLEDDPPARSDSTLSSKGGSAEEVLSVQPLRIVKTGPSSQKPEQAPDSKQDDRPQTGIVDPAAEQPVHSGQPPEVGPPAEQGSEASPESAPLAPAPLKIARPVAPSTQPPPVPTGSPPVLIPPAGTYPIPPAGTYPPQSPASPTSSQQPTTGAQFSLPIHPGPPSGSSPRPMSAEISSAPKPLYPAHSGATTAPSPQQPQYATAHSPLTSYSQAPSKAYTSATSISPVFVQAALPPTLPLGSYFPQQPSYARLDAAASTQTNSAHHSPAASVSSTAQDAFLTTQQVAYACPPPSYDQAVSQGRPANASPVSSLAPTTAPLSPMLTDSSVSSYPYSPADIGAPAPTPPNPTSSQQYPHNPQAPPIPQPSYVNGLQGYHPTPPPLPPRTSPVQGYGHPQSPYGPPPTRPNYVSPPSGPVKSSSGIFSSNTARKLLNKTTEFMDQAITPYLQDHRYKPPYGQYNQYQYPRNRPLQQGQYYPQAPQGYAPAQPTYATPQASQDNSNVPRPT